MEAWKLTTRQYRQLQRLWERIPDPTETFSATGVHYELVQMLNDFGFSLVDSFDAVELAEQLLTTSPRED